MDCDFEFVTKSNYTDLHKSKPVKFANIEGSRQSRMDKRLKERRSTRYDNFVTNRVIIDDGLPLSPYSQVQSPAPAPPATAKQTAIQRKKEMQLWLAEKKKRKADLVKSKVKPFVVPTVHFTLAYKPPSPVTKQAKQRSILVSDRVTRSRRDVKGPSKPNIVEPVATKPKTLKNIVPSKAPPTVTVTSFAPQNARFHPPKVNSFPLYQLDKRPASSNEMQYLMGNAQKQKSSEKLKPVNCDTGRILRNRQTQTASTKPEEEKQNKRVKKVVNVLHKKSAERSRMSLRNQEVLPVERSDTSLSSKEVLPVVISHSSNDDKSDEEKTGVPYVTPVKQGGVPNSESLSEEKLKTPPMQTAIYHTLSAISPFVTMSRGKDKALRERKSKMHDGMLADDVRDEKNTQHFRDQLNGEIDRLRQMSKEWDDYKEANMEIIPDNYQDLIFQASCQTHLLITNKFEQFRGLINRCDNQQMVEGEGAITLQDLQGFWDMVFLQVDDIELRFKKLRELRAKDWAQEEVPANNNKKPVVNKTKKKKVPKNMGTGCLRAMIAAARKAAAENKTLSAKKAHQPLTPMQAFKAELLKSRTPSSNRESRSSVTPARNTSFLKNVSSEVRRMSVIKSTPTSMAILRASYISKCVTTNKRIDGEFTPQAVSEVKLDATPGRSILKVPNTVMKNGNRANRKKSLKVVLFTSNESSGVPATNTIEDGIEPMESDNDIPSIIDRLEVITMETPQEIPAKTRGWKKLTKQKAVEQESVENQEPEKQDDFAVTSVSKRVTRNMGRRTLSLLQNDSMMSLTDVSEYVVTAASTPRVRGRARTASLRKQSVGDLIDFNTPGAPASDAFNTAPPPSRSK